MGGHRLLGRLAILAVMLSQGCLRGVAPDGAEDQVSVESVDVRLEPGERGELVLGVSLPRAPSGPTAITGIQWELWLDDRWFATGDNVLPEPLPVEGSAHGAQLTMPFVFRRASPSNGVAREVGAGVRGYLLLQVDGDTRRWPFQDRRRVRVANAPVIEDLEGE